MIVILDGDIICVGGVIVGGVKLNIEILLIIDLKISELELFIFGI